ncbi:MAG: beta-glucosidase [Candidatus Cryptobacteroides sp.]
MKRIVICALTLCLSVSLWADGGVSPAGMSYEQAYKEAEAYLQKMSTEQKCSMVRGHQRFFIQGFEEIGIPALYMTDASVGIRIPKTGRDPKLITLPEKSTSFPATIVLASTFDRGLAAEYGRAVGEECRANGTEFLLGPGVNIARQPQCGRNFEYMGEDPYLAGELAAEYVKGLQSTGTAACVKHFYGNNSEFYRKSSNSIISERAAMEIYLPAFQKCIDAGVMSIMTSYNQVNGIHMGQNRYALKGLLRQQMGFKWLIMSDWNSIWDLEEMIHSGQNIEMPGNFDFGYSVKDLLDAGKISEEELDNMIRPILATSIAMGFYDRQKYMPELLDRMPEHLETALKTAREGTTLLKNDGLLPLRPGQVGKVLLCGKFVDELAAGKGSSLVEGYDRVSLKDALEAEYGDALLCVKQPSAEEVRAADVVILSVGTTDSENYERPFELASKEEEFINMVLDNAKRSVVVLNIGSAIDMSRWVDKCSAILLGWYPGQIGSQAEAEIISGKLNPSGKLPMTFGYRFKDYPGWDTVPEHMSLQPIAAPYNERMVKFFDVNYSEGVLVGYRWFDTKGIEPLFPFGHGLSYTTFEISDVKLSRKDKDTWQLRLNVKNTGSVDGDEVVQIYLGEDSPTVLRPEKELKDFQRVSLKAGEKKSLSFSLKREDFAYWDEVLGRWHTNEGSHTIFVGNSSRNISAKVKIEL